MEERIKKLISILNKATIEYDKGTPIMTDQEWDNLYFELQELEKETGIILSNSPSNTIYWLKVSELKKVKHDHPMLSLNKTKKPEEVENFLKNQPYVAMFKMDGLTCSLTYENGVLTKAETRGNGIIGEDILHNIYTVKNVPIEIPYKEKLVVDGEIICRKDDFIPFEKEYKNPRNFAAGSIRLLSSKECQTRNLSFVAWEMIEGYSNYNSFRDKLVELMHLGFEIVPFVTSQNHDSIDSVIFALKELNKELKLVYPIDGYVFKFDDIDFGKKQGQTDHHFKNAIAYKFYDETYETNLKNIEWTMGRTGVLTPVAVFDPIDIDGSTVERASLHNLSILKEKLGQHPYEGQKLWICKKNQIIPYVEKAEKISE